MFHSLLTHTVLLLAITPADTAAPTATTAHMCVHAHATGVARLE
jgi:hypothetical protein